MKNLLVTALALAVMILLLVSCDNSKIPKSTSIPKSETTSSISNTTSKEVGSMLDKLHQIKVGWTIDQIEELVGKPDETIDASIAPRIIYYINDTEKAFIDFFGNKVASIKIENTETGETTTILE